VKPSNIITPSHFELAEINRYASEIKDIQAKYREKKENRSDYPLLEQPGRNDFDNKRYNYPLGNNNIFNLVESGISPDPKNRINANEISAI
jgi:hypothetical protein